MICEAKTYARGTYIFLNNTRDFTIQLNKQQFCMTKGMVKWSNGIAKNGVLTKGASLVDINLCTRRVDERPPIWTTEVYK